MHQNSPFWAQKSKNFLGRGHSPLPRPLLRGEGDTPSPHPTLLSAFGASILAPTALDLDLRGDCLKFGQIGSCPPKWTMTGTPMGGLNFDTQFSQSNPPPKKTVKFWPTFGLRKSSTKTLLYKIVINFFCQLFLIKWFLLFWMCDLVALTQHCKLISFFIFNNI